MGADPFLATIRANQDECVHRLSTLQGSGPVNVDSQRISSSIRLLFHLVKSGYYPKLLIEEIWATSQEERGLATILWALRESRQARLCTDKDKWCRIFKYNERRHFQPVWYYIPSLVTQLENTFSFPLPFPGYPYPVNENPFVETRFLLVSHDVDPMPYLVALLMEMSLSNTVLTSDKLSVGSVQNRRCQRQYQVEIDATRRFCSFRIYYMPNNLQEEGLAHMWMEHVQEVISGDVEMGTDVPALRQTLARI